MMKSDSVLPISNTANLATALEKLRQDQLNAVDWKQENLNFVPLRGSWFANSEADFDLEVEINKFLSHENDKKIMLLMGDSGTGKSLYTQGLVINLWNSFSAQSPIPIWISLPSLKDPVHRAIEETLGKYGFNKEQIEELRKTRSFIFILDAYDEIRCEQNLYQTNTLDKWNAKIIITCRREYLYHKDNYKLFFAPFIGDKIQYTQYEEIYIRLFNANQILAFVKQYIASQKPNWDNPEKYQRSIEEITGLKELIKTPFMLKLTVEVLPQIVEKYATQNIQERKKVTQAALYDVFIEQWFIRQKKKLIDAKQIKDNEDIRSEFWSYAKELALEMHKANLTLVNYTPNENSDLFSIESNENQWTRFFTPINPRVELLRTACLVREVSQHHYAFVHSSLIEYFLTRNLYEIIIKQNQSTQSNVSSNIGFTENKQVTLVALSTTAATASSSKQSIQSNQININSKDDYLNQRLIVKEDNTLQFLADRVGEQEIFKKLLFDRVYSSKNSPNNRIAAANAISILNLARIVFSGLDLSHIHIPDADLSEAILHRTNLSNSDLQRVNFQGAYLCYANLSNSQTDDIQLGQLPLLKLDKEASSICYTKDGSYLAVASSNQVVLWDTKTMEVYSRLSGHKRRVTCVTFSPDGKLLASASSDDTVRLWNVASQQLVGKPLQGRGGTNSVAFRPDGKLIASCSGNTLRLWDVASQQALGEPMMGHTEEVHSVAFSPDGKLLASGSSDGTVRLWEVASKQALGEPMKGHTRLVNSVAFSPDGKLLASGSWDYTLRLWDVSSQQALGEPMKGHTEEVHSVAFSFDGKLMVSGSTDLTLRLWDISSQQALGKPLQGHTSAICSVAFSPDGRLLASGSSDNTVRLWDISNQQPLGKWLQGHTKRVSSVAFSPDEKLLASSSHDKTLCLWDVASKRALGKPLQGHTSWVNSVAFSPNGKLLASCSGNGLSDGVIGSGGTDQTLRLWDVASQQPWGKALEGHTAKVTSLAFSPDGKLLASGSEDGTLRLWDVATQQSLGKPLQEHSGSVHNIAFSPNGKLLASCSGSNAKYSDKLVRLWDVASQKALGKPMDHTSVVNSVAFSPDGKLLASGSYDNTVCLWDVFSQQALGEPMKGHTRWINGVAFSPDGKLLASGSKDRTIAIWSVSSKQCLYWINAFKAVDSVCFSPGGHYIAFASGNDIGLFHYQPKAQEQFAFYLIWYSGQILLAADGLSLKNVKGLSSNNLKVLKQNCAMEHMPVEISADDKSPRATNAIEAKQDRPTTPAANYSNMSSSSPVLFKPAADSRKDKNQKNISANKEANKDNTDNKNTEKEKCRLM